MKIAFVIGGLPFGGVESWLFDVAHKLKETGGVQVVIINVSGTGVRMDDYIRSGLDVVCIGNSKKSINTHRINTVFRLRKALRTIQPDIVHTLHFSGDYFGRLAAIGLGIPVVTHLRNIKSEDKAHRRLISKFLSFFTDRYLCVSGEVAETVRKDHNLAGKPVQVLYNAADFSRLEVNPADVSAYAKSGERVLIAVGRLDVQKNYPFLVDVFASVVKACPDTVLLILGEGNKRPEIEERIKALGLENKVFLPGYKKDVPAYLKSAHIFLMPSLYEGFPISHIEAMYCGLPAVISEFTPSREVCGDAAFVCPLDVRAFTESILFLLNNDGVYARMSSAAGNVAADFGMDSYLERLLGIYRELIRNKPGRID